MPSNKDLKRLVRRRMQKTGESYTAARAHLVKQRSPAVPVRDYAEVAGISDDRVKEQTGCTWEKWVTALDRHGAAELPHRDIARLVAEKYGVSGWWAQSITVGYERIKGLRAVGQRRGGGFDANKSRTFPVALDTLYRSFSEKRLRTRWLDQPLLIRTSRRNQSIRARLNGESPVDFYFTEKSPGKSTVAIQQRDLPSSAAREKAKAFWAEHLGALARVL